jgi:hypothetical protein
MSASISASISPSGPLICVADAIVVVQHPQQHRVMVGEKRTQRLRPI